MVEVEIDGKKVEVVEGSMVMHAANKLDIYIPHFCYHKKLSIAANCRMCLVEVEKAPKPLPACATPVTNGMKVMTRSDKAINAQKSVMEFLLINHPLDCPICDQGGECQLQDLAVGYGGSSSRYSEEKRVVFHKSIGPLVSAQEMARCIHCTRCVRFGQEIAGVMELGMAGRGEHSEIMSFVGRSVDSELSGNMIDICPVGALTSKPFRYSARTWELSRRRTVAPHDSLGSNIVTQIKGQQVMRVVPLENDAINECWISDRDRFSYEGLASPERLTQPMIKRDGQWTTTDWQTALGQAALLMATARVDHGPDRIVGLGAPTSTLEELYLLQKLMRALGSDNVDFRLRQTAFDVDVAGQGAPWLGMAIADVESLDRLLLVGSFLRKDAPVFSARVRGAVRRGLDLSILHACDDDLLMPVAHKAIAAPGEWRGLMLQILSAVLQARSLPAPAGMDDALAGVQAGDEARAMAASLCAGETPAVLLGNAAVQHPAADDLMRIGAAIAEACHARFGVIGEAGNSVGGYLAGATPRAVGAVAARALGDKGMATTGQLAGDMRACVLLNVEPALDIASGSAAMRSLAMADAVIALTPYRSDDLLSVAHVLLPCGPFTETGGSFVNAEGRLQTFNGVVQPAGESRPAWKVLRVLANRLDLAGFDQDSVAEVRAEALAGVDVSVPLPFDAFLSNRIGGALGASDRPAATANAGGAAQGVQRIADVPPYFSDALVRHAPSLQQTADAAVPQARMHPDTMARLALSADEPVVVAQPGGQALVTLRADVTVALDTVRLAGAHPLTANLDGFFGAVDVRAVAAVQTVAQAS